jgi:hypothetical protein
MRGGRILRSIAIALALMTAAAFAAPSAAETLSDLSGVSVGMSVAELPASGYGGFACAAGGGSLAGWSDWKRCPAEASGLRAVHAAYEQPGREGTIVAGHPVTLTLFFDGDGKLARILIETDAHARLYMRKKAHLLAQQAKQHYGDDGWTCQEIKPSADEEPIGPTLVKEDCSKQLDDRVVTIHRSLFRKAGSDAKDFVSESRIEIAWRHQPT